MRSLTDKNVDGAFDNNPAVHGGITLPCGGQAVDEHCDGTPKHRIRAGTVALQLISDAAGAFAADEDIGATLNRRAASVWVIAVVGGTAVVTADSGCSRHGGGFTRWYILFVFPRSSRCGFVPARRRNPAL